MTVKCFINWQCNNQVGTEDEMLNSIELLRLVVLLGATQKHSSSWAFLNLKTETLNHCSESV